MPRKHRILIVDDEPIIIAGIRRRLEAAGYECLTAADGLEGFAMAAESQPDLILLDVRMPNCNGFDALARLRESETTREIPVIMVSGNEYDREATIEAGAVDFISKPYRGEELLQAIQTRLK